MLSEHRAQTCWSCYQSTLIRVFYILSRSWAWVTHFPASQQLHTCNQGSTQAELLTPWACLCPKSSYYPSNVLFCQVDAFRFKKLKAHSNIFFQLLYKYSRSSVVLWVHLALHHSSSVDHQLCHQLYPDQHSSMGVVMTLFPHFD